MVYEKHLSEVVDAGILPQFEIYNISVPFDSKSKAKYRIFTSQFEQAAIELTKIRSKNPDLAKKFGNPFDMASHFRNATSDSNLRKAARRFWSGMSMRKTVVYTNPNKLSVALELIKKYPGKKWILFSKSIAMAEELTSLLGDRARTYHSRMTPNERRDVLVGFSNFEFDVLSAVDGLNEGLSVDDVDAAICVSGVSTILTNTQQLGQFGLYLINSVKPKSTMDMAIPSQAGSMIRACVEHIPFVGE